MAFARKHGNKRDRTGKDACMENPGLFRSFIPRKLKTTYILAGLLTYSRV